jgi:hypothetical protein
MRILLCLLVALAGALVAPTADARRASRGYHQDYGYQAYRNGRGYNTAYGYYRSPYTDTQECIRARGADPAGDYAGYPCWAQWALSPKGLRGR